MPFVDPRYNPAPDPQPCPARTTSIPEDLEKLHQLCRECRLYEVERWIEEGRPLQLSSERPLGRGRHFPSALEISLQSGNQALVLLLLCNGYDSNLDTSSPLDLALRSRRLDLLDLLLKWGADPHQVCLTDLFGTYDSHLFERFRNLGVDLTEGHELAETLAYHTSNKPLFGFARRHRSSIPNIQLELDMALAHHAERGNQKGVALCLWAGANPHAPALSFYFAWPNDSDEDDQLGSSAVYRACQAGQVAILEHLKPDPALDDFEELYRVARDGTVVDFFAGLALPVEIGRLIHSHLLWARLGLSEWRLTYTLGRLFEVGGRWDSSTKDEIADIRRLVLRLSDQGFVNMIKLLAQNDNCSQEVLEELGRTSAMRARMKKVGFIPPSPKDAFPSSAMRPSRSREILKKFGVVVPNPAPAPRSLARTEKIGLRRPGAQSMRLTREALYHRVWSQPVETIAQSWGLSGRGLAKACQRLRIPVPSRGYWAKARAGKRVRRRQLPQLPSGEAEEILIWTKKH